MNMNDNEFMRQQQAAVERMKEMSSRAAPVSTGQRMPPVPSFVKVPQNSRSGSNQPPKQNTADNSHRRSENTQHSQNRNQINKNEAAAVQKSSGAGGFLSGLDLPFLDIFSKDTDVALIIGLLLILMSEKADKKLLFALVYILMR